MCTCLFVYVHVQVVWSLKLQISRFKARVVAIHLFHDILCVKVDDYHTMYICLYARSLILPYEYCKYCEYCK